MSTTKEISEDSEIEFIIDEVHEFYKDGYYYEMIPEKLRATLDKQILEFYEFDKRCNKSFDKIKKRLTGIINEQHPVFATVDYYWMEDEIFGAVHNGFCELSYQTFSLCENIKDKQPLNNIYAQLGLWENDGKKTPQHPLLKTLRDSMETISGPELDNLIEENKIFDLLNYQNNEKRHKPVYDAAKKVFMAEFPAMKQFNETEWAIYDALFEKGNLEFRISLFLLELRLDCGISSRYFEATANNIIEKFLKLPKYKREGINKLAERRMMGEKI
jgi:hypothetical protein